MLRHHVSCVFTPCDRRGVLYEPQLYISVSSSGTGNFFLFFRYWPQISGLTLSFVDESSDGRGKDDSRPLVGVRTLCLLQCFDTVGWVTGVISDP